MSYDLYFQSERRVSVEALRAYFADQTNFTVQDDRAHYENEATGVYFGFDFMNDAFTRAGARRLSSLPGSALMATTTRRGPGARESASLAS